MYIIKSWQTAVTLFKDDGEVWVYASVAVARRVLGMSFIRAHVASEFVEYLRSEVKWSDVDGVSRIVESRPVYRVSEYVMRDDAGAKLTADDLEQPRVRRYWGRYYGTWDGSGPVPYTGHGRRYR